MDPVLLHLRTNHFPIILGAVGALAAIVAAIARKDWIWRYALVTLLLSAATAPLAYLTGRGAEEVAEGHENIEHGLMEDHEDSATPALWAMIAAGIAAGVCLAKPNVWTKTTVVVLSVAAAGLTARTSAIAGKIVHNALTVGATEDD